MLLIKSLPKNSLLVLVLGISIFFRFYQLEKLFFFSLDEEVIALHIRQITTGYHFPAIGVNAADTGLYLGPIYFYAVAPLFYLFSSDPVAGALFSSSIGVMGTLAIYWLGSQIGGKRVGLMAALLHGSSLAVALFERKFFNPQPAILVTSLVLVSLLKIKDDHRFVYLLAILLGLTLHLNLSLTIFIPLSLFWLWKQKVNFSKRIAIKAGLLFCVFLSPLFYFDVRHEFQITKAVVNLVSRKSSVKNEPFTVKKLLFPITYLAKVGGVELSSSNILNEFETFAGAHKNSASILGWFLLAISLFAFNPPTRKSKLLIASLAIGFVGLWFYPGRIQEYYATILIAPYLIILSVALDKLSQKVFFATPSLLLLLLIVSMNQLLSINNPHGLTIKKEITKKIIENTSSRQFSLERRGSDAYGYGFSYLLLIQNHPPASSFSDPIISWLFLPGEEPIKNYKEKINIDSNAEAIDIVLN